MNTSLITTLRRIKETIAEGSPATKEIKKHIINNQESATFMIEQLLCLNLLGHGFDNENPSVAEKSGTGNSFTL